MPKECDFIKAISEVLFRAVGVFFSALLLVFYLLNSISLASAGDKLDKLSKEKEELIQENRYLRAEYESRYSLQAIESYAAEKLGMRPCSPEQIEYIELPGEG